MKNKMLTYGLIAVTIVVWGVIIYRIFDGLGSEEDDAVLESPKKSIQINNAIEEKDSFELINHYRDPFLGSRARGNYSNSDVNNASNKLAAIKKIVKTAEPVKPMDWSFIQYIGSVHNKDKKKKVSLILVYGKEYMVGEGDEISGIVITHKEKDSICVKYGGMEKWLKRD